MLGFYLLLHHSPGSWTCSSQPVLCSPQTSPQLAGSPHLQSSPDASSYSQSLTGGPPASSSDAANMNRNMSIWCHSSSLVIHLNISYASIFYIQYACLYWQMLTDWHNNKSNHALYSHILYKQYAGKCWFFILSCFKMYKLIHSETLGYMLLIHSFCQMHVSSVYKTEFIFIKQNPNSYYCCSSPK